MKTNFTLSFAILFFSTLSMNLMAQATVVLRAGGNITTPGDWGAAPDGTTSVLADFSQDNTYIFTANNASRTLNTTWTITANSIVSVGAGGAAFTLDYGPGAALGVAGSTANLVITNLATFSLSTAYNLNPAKTTMNSGSTFLYAAGTTSVATDQYDNLSIITNVASNTSTIDVLGDLNISSGNVLTIDNNGILNVSGNVLNTGGSIAGDNTGSLTFGGGGITHLRFDTGNENFANVNILNSYFAALYTPLTASGNFTVNGGGRFWFLGGSLFLNGNVSFGSHQIRGSGSATIQIAGTGTVSGALVLEGAGWEYLSELTLNRAGESLSIGTPLYILHSLNPTSGTITTNNNVTLYSDANFKGRIGPLSSNGSISGNVTVQQFKPAGITGWVNMCAPGVTGKSFSDWNGSFGITCPSGCPDGSQVAGQPFTSVYIYDETQGAGTASAAAHYVDLPGTGTGIDTKTGYWVYLGNNYPNTGNITISLTGAVNTKTSSGAINLTLTGGAGSENGWNLIANPYPSPIQASQVISAFGANIDPTSLQAYDPDLPGFVPFSGGDVIPMGQAFYVRATNTVAVLPDENWKTTSTDNTSMFKHSSQALAPNGRQYFYDDFLIDLQSSTVPKHFFSQAYFSFEAGAGQLYDLGKDAYFMDNPIEPNLPCIYSISNTDRLRRNAQAAISNGSISIPLQVNTGYSALYVLKPVNLHKLPAGACVVLHDILNNVFHDLRTGAYTTSLSAGQTTPQFELIITQLSANMSSQSHDPICSKSEDGSLIAIGSGSGPWNYTWKDENSNVLKYSANIFTADTLLGLAQGLYMVDVNTVGTCNNASAQFTLEAQTPLPMADFTVNSNTVSAQSNVPLSFTNLSQNASEFTWEFGNGVSVSSLHTNYTYNVPGLYTVKLSAGNGPCQDVDHKSIQVQVLDMPVGIGQNEFSSDELVLVQEASGIYLLVNSGENSEFVLTAYNALGQNLIKEKTVRPINGRIDLSIPASENLLFVKLSNENKSKTFKLVH